MGVEEFIRTYEAGRMRDPFDPARVFANTGCLVKLAPAVLRGARCVGVALGTFKRGEHHASGALLALCDLADRYGVPLVAEAKPQGPRPALSRSQLCAWLRRYGFEHARLPVTYLRRPRVRT